uniref:Uncharacterized protein n=1 Tax=Periophthalmus magnuspinnatus TaxID=409849 RepID=A0A3B3ZLI8_9GOBI
DVCSSCHANATCDDKPNGSGKICNCKYGFVGDGRTFCQKDECRIDLMKICGQHTTCHNTYGSYYCTCLFGYRPSNNMATFIPNDGTNCQECEIEGVCGEGTVCKNLEGGFECYCQMGYKIHEGVVPFHPHRDKATCKVDCGAPVLPVDAVLVSVTKHTFGGVALFECDQGFIWRRGDNSSVCEASGRWTAPSVVCEVDCGLPPVRLYSQMVWDSRSKLGSEVLYRCDFGYRNVERRSVFYCNATGQWDVPPVFCQILCGNVPVLNNTVHVWDGKMTLGNTVEYYCKYGFYDNGGRNSSVCNENGEWTKPTLSCRISCGLPLTVPNTNLQWDGSTNLGSVVWYECASGFYPEREVSACTKTGRWGQVSLIKCGPVPALVHSEVVWHNRSIAVHRCERGYHSWSGTYSSICDSSSGEWRQATITTERKPPINHLHVLNERCLHWKAEKYKGATEDYKIIFTGLRNYQTSFLDKRRHMLSSKADRVEVCLNLLPVTNYSISITAKSAKFTATVFTNTSVYQIFVLPVDGLMVFDCSSPKLSTDQYHTHYITAQIQVKDVGTEMSFTVGDGRFYHGFLNAPLENGREYYIILRSVSEWRK